MDFPACALGMLEPMYISKPSSVKIKGLYLWTKKKSPKMLLGQVMDKIHLPDKKIHQLLAVGQDFHTEHLSYWAN